ncbi:unnamed protein product [Polarella glacialis]|uniref:V-type proton ATPase proteolipid subunit n=1 Tax=Polarella glacialis TaxID=89957 RepID=A0A813G2S9_POLGL|nr:unnamed protein product [Polarella glacialis]
MAVYGASTLLAMQPCDPSSAFFGFMGVTSAIVFANMGAAYGTAKSGVGILSMGVMRPDMVMRSIIPVVMAGVLGIYGLIIDGCPPLKKCRRSTTAALPSGVVN